MALAKYYEDILDRLTEDLSSNVPPQYLYNSLAENGLVPPSSLIGNADEDCGEQEAKRALKAFLSLMIAKIRKQNQELGKLRSDLQNQRQQYDLVIKRHLENRNRKDETIKFLQSKLKKISTVRKH
jgi:hypothetical protein